MARFYPQKYRSLCALVKENGIDLKVNTVVTKLNLDDDFSPIWEIAPRRWKILKMQKFSSGNFDNAPFAVSDEEFSDFCRKQESYGVPFVSENNMRNSYIFVDPLGNLLDNANGNYSSVGNLLKEDFSRCFKRLPLDSKLDLFDNLLVVSHRYNQPEEYKFPVPQ
jgi:radical S-adenosyl methionine domain-containing protein 2